MAVTSAAKPLERGSELADLAAAVMALRARTGQLVLVAGAAGIGKTELLGAARSLQSHGSAGAQFSGQTNPREERPATKPGRQPVQPNAHAIWSEGVTTTSLLHLDQGGRWPGVRR